MDQGKLIIFVLLVIVAAVFVVGVIYVAGSIMLPFSSYSDPKVTYSAVTSQKIVFEKTDTTSKIDYNF